jgi:hypothetical protein
VWRLGKGGGWGVGGGGLFVRSAVRDGSLLIWAPFFEDT